LVGVTDTSNHFLDKDVEKKIKNQRKRFHPLNPSDTIDFFEYYLKRGSLPEMFTELPKPKDAKKTDPAPLEIKHDTEDPRTGFGYWKIS